MKLVRNPQDFSVFCWAAKQHIARGETVALEDDIADQATRTGILEIVGDVEVPEAPEGWSLVYTGAPAAATSA